jgi:hypothetical protein
MTLAMAGLYIVLYLLIGAAIASVHRTRVHQCSDFVLEMLVEFGLVIGWPLYLIFKVLEILFTIGYIFMNED